MTPLEFLAGIARAVMLIAAAGCAAASPRIAIIIDDLGYGLAAGERAIALPGPVACAILPGTPGAARLAASAARQGKEILLHLPMQSMHREGVTEPGALTLDMSRTRLVDQFRAMLADVPHAVGVNNHRGSLLTRHPVHMQWLMEEIRAREPLFFVDSYTTHHSVALAMATESGVPAVKRDVFLDSDPAPERIRAEFRRLKALASRHGAAVAIGHPYDSTLGLLEELLPELAEEGFELVPISMLVANHVEPGGTKILKDRQAADHGNPHEKKFSE